MPAPVIAVAIGTVIVNALRQWGGSILGSALATMGLYFFVAEPAMDVINDELHSRYNLVSGTVRETLTYLNADDFMAMIAAAVVVRLTLNAHAQLRLNKSKAKPGKPVGA